MSETAGFKFNHTMLRVKDPKVSLKFYTEVRASSCLINSTDDSYISKVMGMELIQADDHGDFTLYFLAFDHSNGTQSEAEKKQNRLNREGILELTHNHGTENDPSFAGYASGNTDPGRGFGHIAVSVPDIQAACARLESLGVPFKKKLTDGKMRNIAFALDPDGYWIELVPQSMKLHPQAGQ
ncbi:hypothetical protein EIP86_001685 [Pleurotus ostreatoroseus]|nr:hypothetical protein EIP86_001685 [Pleurotus ostreatoroseus]